MIHDAAWLGAWCLVLCAGVAGGVVLHLRGLAATYGRDLLHVGAGIWVLGWPAWREPVVPTLLVGGVAAITLAVPILARAASHRWAARVRDAFSGGDERWTGLVFYTWSFVIFTAVGLTGARLPAAAALLSLSLGDGVGGFVGRRFGRHHFVIPGAKAKSLEGSFAVAAFAAAGIALAAAWFGAAVPVPVIAGAALAAAAAEAFAPRAADNLVIPPVVWIVLTAAGGGNLP